MSRFVLQKSVRVTGVSRGGHISRVSSDRFWISYYNNLILTNTAGDKLHHLTDISSIWGHHGYKCVYSSPSNGDLLVGMYNTDTNIEAKVVRYNSTGEHIQTIQYNNNTGQRLYRSPSYITENSNGDVIVSDWSRGVVVTDGRGKHRFSYRRPPSGSELFPSGICTDALSHILVCDYNTHTVQILDQNGKFLSQIQTLEHGIDESCCLSYDNYTHLLWVGSENNSTVNIYRVIYEDSLTETLLMEIRGKCISYASYKKKLTKLKEEKLVEEIKHLEETIRTTADNVETLEEKNKELEDIRRQKMRGVLIRSRARWVEEGEKPSHYFCNLENRNFTSKIIPKVETENGNIIYKQAEILNEAKKYYEN
ncbi:uncharacterized protein LOC133202033 [Saccostrea echinata]|uniref:uncharacterized protein LOC133202033 n=1 Tax=Saccostrea echinata TaxID=191078 RepID=UPI002A815150|nr:uncharacterized protein LOC133202033 [Saccostrea echinata]